MTFKTRLTVLLVFLSIASGLAHAEIIRYTIDLRITSIQQVGQCDDSLPGLEYFGCLAVGDVYRGSFGVDSDILLTDGLNITAPIYDFKLPFGNAFYSTGPDNVTLWMFRNFNDFAYAPGFLIEGGDVIGVHGGVLGIGDAPFIDWFASPYANSFVASDQTESQVYGRIFVHRIAEPGSLLLIWLALCSLALSTGKKWRRTPPEGTGDHARLNLQPRQLGIIS